MAATNSSGLENGRPRQFWSWMLTLLGLGLAAGRCGASRTIQIRWAGLRTKTTAGKRTTWFYLRELVLRIRSLRVKPIS